MSTKAAAAALEQDGMSVLQTDTATKVVTRPAVRLQDLYQHTTIVLCRLDRHPYDYARAIIMRPASYEEAIASIIKIFSATDVHQHPKANSMTRTTVTPTLRCRLRSSDNYWMDVDPQCWDLIVDHMEFLLVNKWTREAVDLGVPNYG
ncbi:hypothetical protein CVT25_009702 [Psilocybe cyanescens]|uniref:Uncharacterized protein n=1 Tax=Psilocybe cyanescens TaxID=93625 RepID=A0A409WWH3_PSICY|nr:hypothetical protein CVT25_009702 [Psilocybe cyanescens]